MPRVRLALALIVAATLVGCGGTPRFDHAAGPVGTLYLDGLTKYDKLVALDIHTGQMHKLPVNVSCGDAQVCLVPSGGKLVIGGVGDTHVYDPTAPAGQGDRQIGNGWIIVLSPAHGAVWLGIRDHRKRKRATWPELKMRSVREVTVDGQVIESAHAPGDAWPGAPGAFPAGAVREGLVFLTQHGFVVWRPTTLTDAVRVPGLDALAHALRRLHPGTVVEKVRVGGQTPEVVDTHGDLIAWCAGCAGYRHRLRITNVRTGITRPVKPPPGYSFQPDDYGSAFSPDGSLLALPVAPNRQTERHGGRPQYDASWSMALVGARRGAASVVDRSRIDPTYHAVAWSASGQRLFFAAGERIMAYRPDSARATLLARVNGTIYHMAAL